MKQVVQNLRSGVLELLDVPCPRVSAGHLLIQTRTRLISAGTERMLVEFGRAGMVSKARQQPEKVRQVYRQDQDRRFAADAGSGAVQTRRADAAGLLQCGRGGRSGRRSAAVCASAIAWSATARTRKWFTVPENLCAKIPDNVNDDQAPLAILGAIGLQGIRLLRLELGESVAVFGLGMIGLLAVQMLVNSGCRVLAIDPDSSTFGNG